MDERMKKYCKHCGEQIDADCIICPKCGKQVEELKAEIPNIVINNSNNNVNANTNIGEIWFRPLRSKTVALILAIFLGYLGAHRFYVWKAGTGILWLFTLGMFGIGWIIDIILIISNVFKDKYERPLV